jgi:hypothetical protein
LGSLSSRVKQAVCEADHSPPSSAKVKNGGPISPLSPICLHGMVLNSLNTGATLLTYWELNWQSFILLSGHILLWVTASSMCSLSHCLSVASWIYCKLNHQTALF